MSSLVGIPTVLATAQSERSRTRAPQNSPLGRLLWPLNYELINLLRPGDNVRDTGKATVNGNVSGEF